ncbi:hypothetical protein [Winogradskyella bathintestinalis]|uniref:Uncharacterized protein n=1 Tax=Winogradskyella bathintestinalis TaxID=3035208 RepID=A0ABT7ZTH9_9FLAO|nr:hypothetical protein [Winogradskyella bathintestinalis]MDN3492268.1 hypothetical protein [Winogradskyella bathintestinalis]
MSKKLVVICLINFLIAALMGLALRFSFLDSIGINYRFLTHAHSHVAMLGWVYLMLFTLFVHYFIPHKTKIFNRLFWLTEFAVVGMMISFPIQGYAAISISFSSLHIFCSYYFVFLIWKHHQIKSVVTRKLLKTSLVFMVLSTIGVWCLGPAVSMLGPTSALYQIAIQFFLHFQFNGWFLIAVMAIFFHLLKIPYSKRFRNFYIVLVLSTLLTFALPIQWFALHDALIWINAIGIIMQVIALFIFYKLINPKFKHVVKQETHLVIVMYSFALFCFAVKILFQLLSILPEFSQTVYNHRNFIIGFIHLLMLGVISGFLLSFILKSKFIQQKRSLYIGIYSFLIGFILTELLLVIQGSMFYFGRGILTNYYQLLFLFSLFLPLGIFFILFNIIKNKIYAT